MGMQLFIGLFGKKPFNVYVIDLSCITNIVLKRGEQYTIQGGLIIGAQIVKDNTFIDSRPTVWKRKVYEECIF